MTSKEQAKIAADCLLHLERHMKHFGEEKMIHTDKKGVEYIIFDEVKKAIKMLYGGK